MNYIWNRVFEKGQESTGFVDIYSSNVEGKNVKAIVNYLTQLPDNDNNKKVHVTLFFQGTKSDVTDGLFHWMYDDICQSVKENSRQKFKRESKPLDQISTQTFIVKNIPEFEHFSHADYGFVDPPHKS